MNFSCCIDCTRQVLMIWSFNVISLLERFTKKLFSKRFDGFWNMCSQGNSWYIKHPWQSAAFSHHIGPPLSLLLHSSWTVDTTEICPATKWCGSYTYSIKLKLHYSTSPGGHSSPNPADSHRSLKKPNIAFIKRIISMLNLRFLSNFVSGFTIRISFTIENGVAWISIWQISSSSQSLWCITLPMNLAKKEGRSKSRKSWKGQRYNIVDLNFSSFLQSEKNRRLR